MDCCSKWSKSEFNELLQKEKKLQQLVFENMTSLKVAIVHTVSYAQAIFLIIYSLEPVYLSIFVNKMSKNSAAIYMKLADIFLTVYQ